MRKRAEWMRPADDLVLEYLSTTDFKRPSDIAEAIGKNPKYTGRRCRTLVESGMLENLGHGFYQITDDGNAYLDGDLDASELPRPERTD